MYSVFSAEIVVTGAHFTVDEAQAFLDRVKAAFPEIDDICVFRSTPDGPTHGESFDGEDGEGFVVHGDLDA